MTKEVIVIIRGLQAGPDTDGEPIEMITTGEYYYKNNKHYILYEEVMEGETATNKNRIKIAPGYMELTKRGLVSVDMLFEEDKKNLTHYNTPYGSLLMGIDAKRVDIQESSDEINIVVDYALELNEEHAADCNIQINIRSKSAGNFKLI